MAYDREKQIAYCKAYRASHRESVSAYNAAYKKSHKDEIAAWQANYYATHKERMLAQVKANYQAMDKDALKVEVFSHYCGTNPPSCQKCGYTDLRALSMDHINGDGAKMRKAGQYTGIHLYRFLKKENYPSGYQVLCMNCQWVKRVENRELDASKRVGQRHRVRMTTLSRLES